MYVVKQGTLYMAPSLSDHPGRKALEKDFPKDWKDALTLLYWMYSTQLNGYLGMAPRERMGQILGDYGILEHQGDIGKRIAYLEGTKSFKEMGALVRKCFMSDAARNEEAFKGKTEWFRDQMLDPTCTPDEYLTYAKGLDHATKMAGQYKIDVDLERGQQQELFVPLYLFELPDDLRPGFTKLKHV